MDIKKIAGSFACFLALTGQAVSVDCNILNQEYLKVQPTKKQATHKEYKQYKHICQEIKNTSLMYFILTNDYGVDKALADSLKDGLKNVITQSRKRIQAKSHILQYDEMVYYSSLALDFLFEHYETIGGIVIDEHFDIVEFAKGIEESKKAYSA